MKVRKEERNIKTNEKYDLTGKFKKIRDMKVTFSLISLDSLLKNSRDANLSESYPLCRKFLLLSEVEGTARMSLSHLSGYMIALLFDRLVPTNLGSCTLSGSNEIILRGKSWHQSDYSRMRMHCDPTVGLTLNP